MKIAFIPEQKIEIIRLIKSGNKIGAIKLFRFLSGLGLKESKEYVEMAEKNPAILDDFFYESENTDKVSEIEHSPTLSGEEERYVKDLLAAGQKLQAVKFVKDRTDLYLKESKELVDNLEAESKTLNLNFSAPEIAKTESSETQPVTQKKTKFKKSGEKTEFKISGYTFRKVQEFEKEKKKMRSNSGCMVTLSLFILIGGILSGLLIFS